jgi:hypothetical protein
LKHGKKPTVAQCNLIRESNLDPASWLVVKDTPEEMLLVHRHSDSTTKVIPKGDMV